MSNYKNKNYTLTLLALLFIVACLASCSPMRSDRGGRCGVWHPAKWVRFDGSGGRLRR